MTRTTPPRPLDIGGLFPGLRQQAATATRLHPRPGVPAVGDSSVGGPLLWPADESWPVCTDNHAHEWLRLLTPAAVRRSRAIRDAARARAAATGACYELTDAERAELPAYDFTEPRQLVDQPIPLMPVAQLWRRDIPDFVGPEGTDLLQVLWCPFSHSEADYLPRVRLYWRRAAEIGSPLEKAPEPSVVEEEYLITPCIVHPEQVREYPFSDRLPGQLEAAIASWQADEEKARGGNALSYQSDLSLAPGWKVGGFANWSLSYPEPLTCAECGTPMTLLFTVATCEWDPSSVSWRPIEEPADARVDPTNIHIGRGYDLYVLRCPASFDHLPAIEMQ